MQTEMEILQGQQWAEKGIQRGLRDGRGGSLWPLFACFFLSFLNYMWGITAARTETLSQSCFLDFHKLWQVELRKSVKECRMMQLCVIKWHAHIFKHICVSVELKVFPALCWWAAMRVSFLDAWLNLEWHVWSQDSGPGHQSKSLM